MSGGEQQMLAIGRALMTDLKLLALDEPSMGLAPLLVRMIFETLAAIRASGTAVLLVEQNARRALGLADRGYVLSPAASSLKDWRANSPRTGGSSRPIWAARCRLRGRAIGGGAYRAGERDEQEKIVCY